MDGDMCAVYGGLVVLLYVLSFVLYVSSDFKRCSQCSTSFRIHPITYFWDAESRRIKMIGRPGDSWRLIGGKLLDYCLGGYFCIQ